MSPRERIVSLDALRGFDMFLIVGGRELIVALANAFDVGALQWMSAQTEHVEWDGFLLWDLIFPLFLFLAGVSMPFSLAKRIEHGDSKARLRLHVIRRGLTLVFLGVVYNGLLTLDFENLRYASVLGRIGLAWMFAAIIFLGCGVRGQVAWLVGLLLAYWAALTLVPVPGVGPPSLEPGLTLADYVDRLLVPGRLHRGDRDPEGLFSTIPAISTALLGVMAGHVLRSGIPQTKKAARLFGGGLACLAVGWVWSQAFPLNKNLWSSSFVLWTGGYSLLLLGTFYFVIDVLGFKRWTFFFVVIGSNAITIYLLEAFVDWSAIVDVVLRGARIHAVFVIAAAIALRWLVLFALHRRRIFLRV
jgi:predicted acyltransferase